MAKYISRTIHEESCQYRYYDKTERKEKILDLPVELDDMILLEKTKISEEDVLYRMPLETFVELAEKVEPAARETPKEADPAQVKRPKL